MTSTALLVAGLLAVVLSNGRYATSSAAWIAPALLLLFLGRQRPWRRLSILIPCLVAASFVMWRGYIPAPGWLYYAIAGSYGLAYALPYVVEASLGSLGRRPWTSTLLFPCAWVSVELLLDRLSPYGSWISIAYTQIDLSAIRQSASVVGLAGITFFVTWTSTMLAWVVLRSSNVERARSGIVCWTLVAATMLAYGELRLRRTNEPAESIRTALISPCPDLREAFERELAPVPESGTADRAALDPLVEAARALNEDLIAATRREARAGARLIAWSETAAKILSTGRGGVPRCGPRARL